MSEIAKLIVYMQVRTVRVETRKNEIVNRLNKTKTEQTPDLKGGWSRCLLSIHNIFNYKTTTWCLKLIPMRTYIYFFRCCY